MEWKSEAAEAASVRKEILTTKRDNSDVMMDNEKYVKSGTPAVGERRSSQSNAVFKAGFSATDVTPMKATADLVGQG